MLGLLLDPDDHAQRGPQHRVEVELLRALESKTPRRVGGTQDLPLSAVVMAATHHDLLQLVDERRFRSDLLYRIGDLRSFVKLLSACGSLPVDVGQLQSLLRMRLQPRPALARTRPAGVDEAEVRRDHARKMLAAAPKKGAYSIIERTVIEVAVEQASGNLSAAARHLGLGRRTIERRLASNEASEIPRAPPSGIRLADGRTDGRTDGVVFDAQ